MKRFNWKFKLVWLNMRQFSETNLIEMQKTALSGWQNTGIMYDGGYSRGSWMCRHPFFSCIINLNATIYFPKYFCYAFSKGNCINI